MPCRYEEPAEAYNRTISDLRTVLDERTRMLCALCALSKSKDIDLVPGLRKWWEVHQVVDKRGSNDYVFAVGNIPHKFINVGRDALDFHWSNLCFNEAF